MQDSSFGPISTPQETRRRGGLRRLFVAADGRVAVGWRLLLYVVALVAAQAAGAGVALGLERAGAPEAIRGLALPLVYAAATIALVVLLRRKLDRRSTAALGLGAGSRPFVNVIAGAVVALAMLGAVLGIEHAAGWVRVEAIVPWTGAIAGRAARGAALMCAVGLAEELVFRGAFLANLAERRSLRFATIVSALIFGAVHVLSAPPTPVVLVSALAATTLLVAARAWTGALWWSIGWHAAWDFGQDHVFGLAAPGPSGPTAIVRLAQSGPPLWVGAPGFMESGLVILLVGAAAAAVLVALGARAPEPVRWREPLPGAAEPAVRAAQ